MKANRSLRLPTSLGKRLMIAFVVLTALVLCTGIAAWTVWERLEKQVERIVDESLPAINGTYQLERATSHLLVLLLKLRDTRSNAEHQQLYSEITQNLNDIQHASVISSRTNNETPEQRLKFLALKQDVEFQAGLLNKQIKYEQAVQQLQKQIQWLHQDLVDDVAPLLQEVEWHLSGMLESSQEMPNFASAVKEFAILQDLTFKENELQQLVTEVIAQHYQQDLSSAFLFIGYKTEEIARLTNRLADYPSTVSYRQILSELIEQVKPDGPLHKLLQEDVANYQQLRAMEPRLDKAIAQYQLNIQQVVIDANNMLGQAGKTTKKMVTTGKIVMGLVVFLALTISIFVLVFLIGRRLVRRLNLLGQDLTRIAQGEFDFAISVTGRDEIGRMGENLRRFCEEIKKMEKTNALNLINNTHASLITCYPNGTIESVNPSAQALLAPYGLKTGQPLWYAFPGMASHLVEQQFIAGSELECSGCSECIVAIDNQGEPSYLHLFLRRYEQANSAKLIITITDVTRQELNARELSRQVEERTLALTQNNQQLAQEIEQRKRAQDELIQAAKMAVMGQAMTSLAHELNQPLSAMRTYIFTSRMCVQRGELNPLSQGLVKMEKLTLRMNHIISALRNFARKSSVESPRSAIELQEVATQAIVLLQARAKKDRCQLQNSLPTDLVIYADNIQMEQVFVNLLVNSLDAVATTSLGCVTIDLLVKTDTRIRCAISDNGPGFSAELLPRLFTPFTTSKEIGLGLGLSICRSLLEKCDGEISLASNLNRGAMVILEFNAANDPVTTGA